MPLWAILITTIPSASVILGGLWWTVKKIVHIADTVNQLLPNGGKSVADRVNQINKRVTKLEKKIAELPQKIDPES